MTIRGKAVNTDCRECGCPKRWHADTLANPLRLCQNIDCRCTGYKGRVRA